MLNVISEFVHSGTVFERIDATAADFYHPSILVEMHGSTKLEESEVE